MVLLQLEMLELCIYSIMNYFLIWSYHILLKTWNSPCHILVGPKTFNSVKDSKTLFWHQWLVLRMHLSLTFVSSYSFFELSCSRCRISKGPDKFLIKIKPASRVYFGVSVFLHLLYLFGCLFFVVLNLAGLWNAFLIDIYVQLQFVRIVVLWDGEILKGLGKFVMLLGWQN